MTSAAVHAAQVDSDRNAMACPPTRSRNTRRCAGVASAAAAACLMAMASPAAAMDLSLMVASAETDHVRKAGIVLGWQRPQPLWQGRVWRLGLRHELVLAGWRVPRARDLVEVGYSPVLRLERPSATGTVWFVEASIGVRLLSHTRVSTTRDLSSAFQFSDQLGAGVQWGPAGRHTAGLRYEHMSNAGIRKPNFGINFGQLYYRYRF